MLGKYHITGAGDVFPCKARVSCPFASEDEHYATEEEARDAYEEKMQGELLRSYKPGEVQIEDYPDRWQLEPDSILIPKGVYVLGDPSYVFDKDVSTWKRWSSQARKPYPPFQGNPSRTIGALVNGYPVVSVTTPYEDGIFTDSLGRSYNIRSGNIGLIPYSLIEKMKIDKDDALDDTNFINFDETTRIDYKDGHAYFGRDMFMKLESTGEINDDFDSFQEDPYADPTNDEELYDISDIDSEDQDNNYY